MPFARKASRSMSYELPRNSRVSDTLVNSVEAAKEVLLNAEPKFPKEAIKYNLACYFCQLGEIETATNYLKKAFEIDLNWRMAALDDEDLKPLWESL